MAAGLAIWLVLDAVQLKHNAEVSPVGTRRSVALELLGPIAATSSALQLSRIEQSANRALGRDGNVPGNGHTFVVALPSMQGAIFLSHPTPKEHVAPGTDRAIVASATSPVRVLLLGDSLGLDLGGSLQNRLASSGVATATLDGKESTGLTRPDYFDWPAELAQDLPRVSPQIVVAMIGANDPQDFLGPPDIPYGSPMWNREYRSRATSFMREATSTGATLVWVSLPPMQDPALNAKIQTINALQRQAAALVPHVIYVDSSPIIGDGHGGYTAFVTSNGQLINARTPDGVHITPAGGDLLSTAVIRALRQDGIVRIP